MYVEWADQFSLALVGAQRNLDKQGLLCPKVLRCAPLGPPEQ